MWIFPKNKPQMHNNIGLTSVQKVCDEHYSACKLPDQKKTAMQTHSVAQPVTWVGRRWGDHNTQQISHAQLQPHQLIYQWRTLKNHQKGEESGCLPTTELQLREQLRP